MPRNVSNTRRRAGRAAKAERLGNSRFVEIVHRHDHVAREILLVVLQHERDCPRVHPLVAQVRVQVLKAFDILVELTRLTIGDEHDPVRALEHQLSRGLVVHLARHRVELQSGCEARWYRGRAVGNRKRVRSVCVASETIFPFRSSGT